MNNDYIYKGKGKNKYFKAICIECGCDRGYQQKHSFNIRCSKCAANNRSKNCNPMQGRTHKNREKFRKNTYPNIDYNDRITVYSKSGNKRIKYKKKCPICSKDMGYHCHYDSLRKCIKCQGDINRKTTLVQRRLKCSMRANVNSRLKTRLLKKNRKSTFDVVGYTVDDLKNHLESLWEPWMSWDNYGLYNKNRRTWQIDHVKPDSWFYYGSIDDKEFKKSWDLKNLQPKEAIKNLQKSNKYEG